MGAAFPPMCWGTAGWQGCGSPWRWALPEEALSKHCSNQQPFMELLEGGSQELSGGFWRLYIKSLFQHLLALGASQAWSRLQGGCWLPPMCWI